MNSHPVATDTFEPPLHGDRDLPAVTIDGYSLEIEDAQGLVGDRASQTAFRELLTQWRGHMESAGRDPLGPTPSEEMSKKELDRIASAGDSPAARTVALAVAEFSDRLAGVIRRLLKDPSWRGVQHIAIGGGFKESEIGRIAIRQTGGRLHDAGIDVTLRAIHHEADDAGLIGGISLVPHLDPAERHAMLAIDIGGTNVRCGIVTFGGAPGANAASARVVQREKWKHADEPGDQDLVEGIVAMLRRLIARAEKEHLPLRPVITVACPGVIRANGSIDRGAQNLPSDWRDASFHLPRRLAENIAEIGGQPTRVVMHNDAVVQGLSELPFIGDRPHWAVLTIGTGLGNASFSRR